MIAVLAGIFSAFVLVAIAAWVVIELSDSDVK